jgi:hypothetical protein
MALHPVVADTLIWDRKPCGPDAAPLGSGGEAKERFTSIFLRADPNNTDPVYVGDRAFQPLELAPGDAVNLPVSKRNDIYFYGTSGDYLVVCAAAVMEQAAPLGVEMRGEIVGLFTRMEELLALLVRGGPLRVLKAVSGISGRMP